MPPVPFRGPTKAPNYENPAAHNPTAGAVRRHRDPDVGCATLIYKAGPCRRGWGGCFGRFGGFEVVRVEVRVDVL